MNKKIRNASLIALAAGVVLVPLVKFMIRRMRPVENNEEQAPETRKTIFSAYRGQHKPHHRKASSN